MSVRIPSPAEDEIDDNDQKHAKPSKGVFTGDVIPLVHSPLTISRKNPTGKKIIEREISKLSEMDHSSEAAENTAVLSPDISPDLQRLLDTDLRVKECFLKILTAIQKLLVHDPNVVTFRVVKLNDPEGSKLRIYFVIQMRELSKEDKRHLKRRIIRIVDDIVQQLAKNYKFDREQFVQLRTIFGTIVEVQDT
ncbi:MAG: hypothetical protein K9W43_13710 [Candidatus Thorarchaeota archaeon]|nr:hypothetical protein [Candidatus Thorarchaeota archaeon]